MAKTKQKEKLPIYDFQLAKTISKAFDEVLPVPLLDELAQKILALKRQFRQNFLEDLLHFKWSVGEEIFVSRVKQEGATFRKLEELTGIDHVELFRCVKFYEKYPNQEYQLKAWRRHVKELRVIEEPKLVTVSSESAYRLMCGDFREKSNEIENGSVDIIITDPPYGKGYIPLYEDLAKVASCVLKDGGSLVIMTGQSYFPEILQNLSKHLTYNWTMAYLTPGGQSAQLWERKVNTFWKPVLWFVKGKYEGNWIGDVAKSNPNDPDKRYSTHGQSESGMLDIVKRFVKINQVVLDPFMGAGTTGVAALKLGCSFIGIDNDPKMVEIAEKRLKGLV